MLTNFLGMNKFMQSWQRTKNIGINHCSIRSMTNPINCFKSDEILNTFERMMNHRLVFFFQAKTKLRMKDFV